MVADPDWQNYVRLNAEAGLLLKQRTCLMISGALRAYLSADGRAIAAAHERLTPGFQTSMRAGRSAGRGIRGASTAGDRRSADREFACLAE